MVPFSAYAGRPSLSASISRPPWRREKSTRLAGGANDASRRSGPGLRRRTTVMPSDSPVSALYRRGTAGVRAIAPTLSPPGGGRHRPDRVSLARSFRPLGGFRPARLRGGFTSYG